MVEKYGKHVVYSDGGKAGTPKLAIIWDWSIAYTPPYEKSLVERANEYLKDRIEEFDDYWPCMKREPRCDLKHVWNWLNLWVDMHYARRRHMTFSEIVSFLSSSSGGRP